MRIFIVTVGKMKNGPERELVNRYLSRAKASGKNLGLNGFDVIELPESRAGSAKARKAEEARAILKSIPEQTPTIALDEIGASMGSNEFAQYVAKQNDAGQKSLCFVIGGADGLDETIRQHSRLVLSFSPLTWPHQIVRLLLGEQLYRMTTILSRHPYHRN